MILIFNEQSFFFQSCDFLHISIIKHIFLEAPYNLERQFRPRFCVHGNEIIVDR